jgi:biopolymer transport protein TolR
MIIQTGEKNDSMSEPNIVPLIDVLLILIIIFMAITPTTPAGMAASIPQPPPKIASTPASPPPTIIVQVRADGRVRINQTDTAWNNLGVQLTDIFKIRAEKVAFVKSDDTVPFDRVAQAIDIMRGAGIVNIGLVTAKMEVE